MMRRSPIRKAGTITFCSHLKQYQALGVIFAFELYIELNDLLFLQKDVICGNIEAKLRIFKEEVSFVYRVLIGAATVIDEQTHEPTGRLMDGRQMYAPSTLIKVAGCKDHLDWLQCVYMYKVCPYSDQTSQV